MRRFHKELAIGGHVDFEYANSATEALEETGERLARGMDQL